VFKQLYKRPVDAKPACRRHLFPDAVFGGDRQPLIPGVCLCHLSRKLGVELWSCGKCGVDWLAHAKGAFVCPLPTKATRESLAGSSGSTVQASTTFSSFPEIWAFLTSLSCPDGSARSPGTVSLSLNGGIWNLALNDPTTGLYAALSGQSFDDLILMVEARLAEGTMPWKVSKYPPRKGK